MAFKPNYRLQRAERTRAKKAKAEEKLRNRQAHSDSKPQPDEPADDTEPPKAEN